MQIEGQRVADTVEQRWAYFAASILRATSYNIRWAATRGPEGLSLRRPDGYSDGRYREQVVDACISWLWVFGGLRAEVSFEDVCLAVDRHPERVRRLLAEQYAHQRDINRMVKVCSGLVREYLDAGYWEKSASTDRVEPAPELAFGCGGSDRPRGEGVGDRELCAMAGAAD